MGMLSGEHCTGKGLLIFPQQPGWDVPVPSTSSTSLGDITGHRAAERPVSPFAPFPETRGGGGEAVNSALPLIKHLAVTEASQHASFSDTFTVWGNGVSGL